MYISAAAVRQAAPLRCLCLSAFGSHASLALIRLKQAQKCIASIYFPALWVTPLLARNPTLEDSYDSLASFGGTYYPHLVAKEQV